MFLLICSFSALANAQVFTDGDISLMQQPMMSHDSSLCSSSCNLMYLITVSNSFTGDSLKIKDMSSGYVFVAVENSTGQNPWSFSVPMPIYNMFVSDDLLSGGAAGFFGPLVKAISGPDTILNINNFYMYPVSNPCLYGTVTGQMYIDNNTDCAYNAGDQALSSIMTSSQANLNSPSMSSISSTAYSNGSGIYNMTVQKSWMTDYTVYIPTNYQFMFPSTYCSPGIYSFTTLPQINVDFSLQCSSNVDVQCGAGSSGIIRPNVPFYMFPAVSNTGCDSASGQLKLILDSRVVYTQALSSVPSPTISGDTLIWNYSNLTNITSGGYWNSFFAHIHLTPTLAVTSGDSLCFRILTNVPAADIDPSNNDYSFCLPVVNSFDPNFKEVSPIGKDLTGGIDYYSDTTLSYTVHFQNTGTATALNISIIDSLDSDIIPNSLVITGSSHYVSPQWIAPGVVKFDFFNINLPDSNSNEAASHGMVSFKIKRQKALPIGTQIKNTAGIYFDYNPAIVTNTVLNTIIASSGVAQVSANRNNVMVYPNPSSDDFILTFDNIQNERYTFTLCNIMGQIVQLTDIINSDHLNIDGSALVKGIYFYRLSDSKGSVAEGKLVKL